MPRWPKQEEKASTVVVPEKTERGGRFLPYEGKDSLPAYTVTSKGDDKRGKMPSIKKAPSRFSVARVGANVYKVLTYYRTPRGVVRRLWKVLKISQKRPKDAALLRELKDCGIPGAF